MSRLERYPPHIKATFDYIQAKKFMEQLNSEEARAERLIEKLSQDVFPISGTICEQYLRQEGINIEPGTDVGYKKEVDFYKDDGQGNKKHVGQFPAMLWNLRDKHGKRCTYHITYLRDTDQGIASTDRSTPAPRDIEGGGVWLRKRTDHQIAVGSSIWDCLAWLQLNQRYTGGVVACLDHERLLTWSPPEKVTDITVIGSSNDDYLGQSFAYGLAHQLSGDNMNIRVACPNMSEDRERNLSYMDLIKRQ